MKVIKCKLQAPHLQGPCECLSSSECSTFQVQRGVVLQSGKFLVSISGKSLEESSEERDLIPQRSSNLS